MSSFFAQGLDPVLFSRGLGLVPDPWQKHVLRYSEKRLIMNCSRQSGKSTTAAVKALRKAIYTPGSLTLQLHKYNTLEKG